MNNLGKVIQFERQDPRDRLSWIPLSKYKPKSEGQVLVRVVDDPLAPIGTSVLETTGRYVEGFMCVDPSFGHEVFLLLDRVLYWKPIEEGDE